MIQTSRKNKSIELNNNSKKDIQLLSTKQTLTRLRKQKSNFARIQNKARLTFFSARFVGTRTEVSWIEIDIMDFC